LAADSPINGIRVVGVCALLLLLAGLSGCGSGPKPSADLPAGVEEGIASYYAHEFNGRRTASGEVFDMNKLTAAHPTLPFDTIVRVTNLDNGKTVTLRINDRGPFKKGRIIDVSYEAAKRLDFVRQGLAEVRVEAIGRE
jgi:rare lipoprotein A